MAAEQLPSPNWYVDPWEPSRHRWWDGERWTEHIRQSVLPEVAARVEPHVSAPSSIGNGQPSTVRRGANAFVVDFTDSVLIRALVASYAKTYNGVWVGGTAILTNETLEFQTNAANRAFHGRRRDTSLRLVGITDIVLQRAMLTNIIAIRADGVMLQIRCFGARDLAAEISTRAGIARQVAGDRAPAISVRELNESLFAKEFLELIKAAAKLAD
jgi:Protein of unknown function (DUF2510)